VTEAECRAPGCTSSATERRGVCRFHKHVKLPTRQASRAPRSSDEPEPGVEGFTTEQLDDLWSRLSD
jgi:hypothetical protein